MTVRPIEAADLDAVLKLNAGNVAETGPLECPELAAMLDEAFAALAAGPPGAPQAFLIAFDQTAGYGSRNFRWFAERYERFVYVDRIVVGDRFRRMGHARRLYEALLARAREGGHTRLCAEVNVVPENPVSHGFHRALGFTPLGDRRLEPGKVVRYYLRPL